MICIEGLDNKLTHFMIDLIISSVSMLIVSTVKIWRTRLPVKPRNTGKRPDMSEKLSTRMYIKALTQTKRTK